jgi:NAD(P)-dependent dehydrogenase (short-subunit alcohol dehydrogenase family)
MNTLLITGGASGIGLAAAKRMAERWRVVIADKDGDRAGDAAAELSRQGRQASAVSVDVSNAQSVAAMMETVSREVGPVHALFNNAGIGRANRVESTPEAEWDLMMDVHVKGTYLCCQAVLSQMCERRSGVIVNMSSDYAVKGMAGGAAYAAAKSAIFSLTKSLAMEFASFGVRVNALGPGPIDTPLLRAGRDGAVWDAVAAARAELVPMGRLGRPDEIAAVLSFLLDDSASFMTGQIVHPNGGQISW